MGKKMKLKINLNADVAEGYGRWTMGNDKDTVSYTHLTLPTTEAV